MPEARIVLAEAAIYVATAPKSNSAICAMIPQWKMCGRIRQCQCRHIYRMRIGKGAGKLGHGVGYKYAHNYNKNHYVRQQYLPDGMRTSGFTIRIISDMKNKLLNI